MDNHGLNFWRKSNVASSTNVERPKANNDDLKDVSSAAGGGGNMPNPQVSPSRRISDVAYNHEMTMKQGRLWFRLPMERQWY